MQDQFCPQSPLAGRSIFPFSLPTLSELGTRTPTVFLCCRVVACRKPSSELRNVIPFSEIGQTDFWKHLAHMNLTVTYPLLDRNIPLPDHDTPYLTVTYPYLPTKICWVLSPQKVLSWFGLRLFLIKQISIQIPHIPLAHIFQIRQGLPCQH